MEVEWRWDRGPVTARKLPMHVHYSTVLYCKCDIAALSCGVRSADSHKLYAVN